MFAINCRPVVKLLSTESGEEFGDSNGFLVCLLETNEPVRLRNRENVVVWGCGEVEKEIPRHCPEAFQYSLMATNHNAYSLTKLYVHLKIMSDSILSAMRSFLIFTTVPIIRLSMRLERIFAMHESCIGVTSCLYLTHIANVVSLPTQYNSTTMKFAMLIQSHSSVHP